MIVSNDRYDYRGEYKTRAYYVDDAGHSVHWRVYRPLPGKDVNKNSHHITFRDASYYYYNPDFSRYATDKCGRAIYIEIVRGQVIGWVETKLTGDCDRLYFIGDKEQERVVGKFISKIPGRKCGAFREILLAPRRFPSKSLAELLQVLQL